MNLNEKAVVDMLLKSRKACPDCGGQMITMSFSYYCKKCGKSFPRESIDNKEVR